ncbi:hypothetical protein Godav_005973 [Gossypium davidsonii]|nr:hypothetical protein [Gossypium davidsonii]MBA0655637.1 hypothetical protein [Gossypium klotzschianum]
MLSGKPLDWSPMRFYTDVETLTGSVYLEFGELLDTAPLLILR